MFLTSLLGFLKPSSRAHAARGRRPRGSTFRPQLEPLEDRCVPSTIIFQDNMENGSNGWTTTGSDGITRSPTSLWHLDSRRANSPSTAWYYGKGDYDTGYWTPDPWFPGPESGTFTSTANWGTLTSPAISLAGVTRPTLAFAEWSAVEPDPTLDRTIVEVSTNGTKFKPVFESHGTGWDWQERVVDLSAYAGNTIYVRFHFDTINQYNNYYEGWYIDDVAVYSGPVLAINDVAVTEGNSGTANATFTVSLQGAGSEPVTVNYASADATALAGSDYQATSGTLTFVAGQTSQTITVPVLGDRLADQPTTWPTSLLGEGKETFVVTLSGASNASIADARGVGTIQDDESRISINSVSLTEGNSGTVPAVFTVSLSAAYDQAVTVNYATYFTGSAAPASDYLPTSGTLTFAAGEISQTVTVLVVGDTLDEPNESLLVALDSPSSNAGLAIEAIWQSQGWGTILDDDPPPTLSVSDVSLLEGNSGATAVVFTVSLSAPSGLWVGVTFASADGTAVHGMTTRGLDSPTAPPPPSDPRYDYVGRLGGFDFAPGETSGTFTLWVYGDTYKEPDETFFVNLSSPSNATIADGQGVGTIRNDDAVPALFINNVSLVEGNRGTTAFVFTVSLSAPSDQTVTVSYATADGPADPYTAAALAGSDYQATSGTLTFAPGETTKTITILVFGDTKKELNEFFSVNLSNALGAPIADGLGLIYNVDTK